MKNQDWTQTQNINRFPTTKHNLKDLNGVQQKFKPNDYGGNSKPIFSMALPKRRRQGIKRVNTNLKFLVEDRVNDGNSEAETNEAAKQGVFTAHGFEYVYDRRSLFIFSSEWKIRKCIVWISVWEWFDHFILA